MRRVGKAKRANHLYAYDLGDVRLGNGEAAVAHPTQALAVQPLLRRRHESRSPPAPPDRAAVARMSEAKSGAILEGADPGYRFAHPGYDTISKHDRRSSGVPGTTR